LAPGQIYSLKINFPTYTPIQFQQQGTLFNNFIEIKSNDSDEATYKFLVYGQVLKPSVSQQFAPPFVDDHLSQSGVVSAHRLLDGQPDRVIQAEDAAVFFDLPARSRIDLAMSGELAGWLPGSAQCEIRFILSHDSNENSVLDLSERIDHLGEYSSGNLNVATPPSPQLASQELQAGKYIIHISILKQPPTGYPSMGSPAYPMAFELDVTREVLPLPAVTVSGKNAGISSGDTTPSTGNGTSFGTWVQQGTLPELRFEVENSGPSGAANLLAAVQVSGDFELLNGLPVGGVTPGGSDEIVIQLRPDRTGLGAKSGRITIDPTEPGVPNFFFDIGGAVVAPFASLSNGKLTVSGTSADDTILMAVSGQSLVVTRNNRVMNFSASAVTNGVVVNCAGGNDVVTTSSSVTIRQTLNGGAGNDILRSGKGSDVLNGDEGNDYLDGGSRGDVFNGGIGSDTAKYNSRTANLDITLDGLANDGQSGEGDNVMPDVEHVIGGLGDDRIVGNGFRNRLRGGSGNDSLFGAGSDDTLYGEAGNDLLDGGSGANSLVQ
jgi:hypothetical protein